MARLGAYHITGLDISRCFVRIAADNACAAGVTIDFQRGDVAHMPFESESFDFVVCVAVFKNFPDPVAALDEIHRVLRPGARASIFDLRKDARCDAIDREVLGRILLGPLAGRLPCAPSQPACSPCNRSRSWCCCSCPASWAWSRS